MPALLASPIAASNSKGLDALRPITSEPLPLRTPQTSPLPASKTQIEKSQPLKAGFSISAFFPQTQAVRAQRATPG
jgi:hypothetical protein